MYRGVEEVPFRRQARDLEQYRRLIKLQKEMVTLARQNEEAKRECDDLREELEMEFKPRARAGQFRLKAGRVLKRLSKLAADKSRTIPGDLYASAANSLNPVRNYFERMKVQRGRRFFSNGRKYFQSSAQRDSTPL